MVHSPPAALSHLSPVDYEGSRLSSLAQINDRPRIRGNSREPIDADGWAFPIGYGIEVQLACYVDLQTRILK